MLLIIIEETWLTLYVELAKGRGPVHADVIFHPVEYLIKFFRYKHTPKVASKVMNILYVQNI